MRKSPRHKSSRRKSPSSSRPSASTSVSMGQVRIIGGTLKRSLLQVLSSPGLRPTPDRVRETLFNWLASDLHNARVLDPFAGSGALGFEAVSRGATHVQSIELNTKAIQLLRENSERLKVTQHMRFTQADALTALEHTPDRPYDIVFLDPPFHQSLASKAAQLLEEHQWLTDDALIYVESESEHPASVPETWRLLRETKAGESLGRLYLREPRAGDMYTV